MNPMNNPIPEPVPARVELERAARAREALENPLIAEALSAWELEITEAWKTSPLRDAEGRERLRQLLEASKTFKRHLTSIMETGELRKVEMLRKQSLMDRLRRAA